MISFRWPALAIILFLLACQPQTSSTITIIDGNQIHTLTTNERVPSKLIVQAGIVLSSADRVIFNGNLVPLDQPMAQAKSIILQIRRAVTITVNGQTIQTTALTVGEAMAQTGVQIYAADQLNPPADTPLTNDMNIKYIASRKLTVSVDGKQIHIRSASGTVGSALAEAGIPLLGLDSSQPSENEALPQDGQIRVTRISESVAFAWKQIPFTTQTTTSVDVELGQQQVLQAGIPGLAVSQIRIRYEDGQEVSRITEPQIVVRAPTDQVVANGTKVVIHTISIGGLQVRYTFSMDMFATSYSPCRSDPHRCYYGTSSGTPVQKGIVAMSPDMYAKYLGQRLYIEGYGLATVGDLCQGCVGKAWPWIDLGYSDNDYVGWGNVVKVYFLAP